MEVKCEFCENIFKNIVVLNSHKRRAKYCLNIQKKVDGHTIVSDIIKCQYCEKEICKDTLNRHLKKCKNKCQHEIEKLKIEECDKDEKIAKLESELRVKNMYILKLENEFRILESNFGRLVM